LVFIVFGKNELKNLEEFLITLLSRFEDHFNEERKAKGKDN